MRTKMVLIRLGLQGEDYQEDKGELEAINNTKEVQVETEGLIKEDTVREEGKTNSIDQSHIMRRG
jgi:hypothetical protein